MVISIIGSGEYYSYTAKVTLLQLHSHSYTVSFTLLQLHCYSHTVTVTLLQLHCYSYTVTITGGSNPIFPMGKICLFPFFHIGKNGRKVHMEREGKAFVPLSFHILFFHFCPCEKMGKDTNFPWE